MNYSAQTTQASERYYCMYHYCAGIEIDSSLAFASQEYGSAQASAYSGAQAPMLPNPTRYARSWDARGDDVEPLGLEAAIAAAKASNEAKALARSIASSGASGTSATGGTMGPQASPVEEVPVIDLLSDEDAAESGGGANGLGEHVQVSHTTRMAGASCNELVVLDGDTVEETCAVPPLRNNLEPSETKPPSCGPDKALESSDAKPPSCGSDQGLEYPEAKPASCGLDKGLGSSDAKPPLSGPDKLADANASPDIVDPLQSTDGGKAATKPDGDHAGRGDGDKMAVHVPTMKTVL